MALPFGGLFLGIIVKELAKSVFNGAVFGQVPTTKTDPVTSQPVTKHWLKSKSVWSALAVVGYVAFNIMTGTPLDITDINSIITNGDNLFLLGASILMIYGRKKV